MPSRLHHPWRDLPLKLGTQASSTHLPCLLMNTAPNRGVYHKSTRETKRSSLVQWKKGKLGQAKIEGACASVENLRVVGLVP